MCYVTTIDPSGHFHYSHAHIYQSRSSVDYFVVESPTIIWRFTTPSSLSGTGTGTTSLSATLTTTGTTPCPQLPGIVCTPTGKNPHSAVLKLL